MIPASEMTGLRIVFRCDASASIGGGHVMRGLTLAGELMRRGADILFATNPGAGQVAPALTTSGLRHIEVGTDHDSAVDAILQVWPQGADVIIIDLYSCAGTGDRIYRRAARRIMVIDDLANRPHDCDILLDQNFGRRASDYDGLLSGDCTLLVGPRYALLRPEFALARESALARRVAACAHGRRAERILVSLGLTDVGGVTAPVVEAAISAGVGAIFDVVVGQRAASLPRLRELAATRDDVVLHVDSGDMCTLMARADIAIGAGGTTSWERCSLGLPTLMLILADNQIEVAQHLSKAGAAIVCAIDEPSRFATLLRQIAHDPEALAAMSRAAAAVTDGEGSHRVASLLAGLAQSPLSAIAPATTPPDLRKAQSGDARILWLWRNDAETRRQSKTTDEVPWETHRDWFHGSLQRTDRIIYIAQDAITPLGTVRFDRVGPAGDDRWLVSIVVAPEARGRHIGKGILAEACDRMIADVAARSFTAEIRPANVGSQRIFEACGFVRRNAGAAADFLVFERNANAQTAETER